MVVLMSEQPNDLVRSVSRAFRVLEEVAASTTPLTVKAIARRTRLNLSTTYHLVRTLGYEDYLLRLPDGRYVLGNAVALRYRDLLVSFGRPPDTHRVLQQLSEVTRRSAYLGRIVGGYMRVTDRVEGPESPWLDEIEFGLPVPAHASAMGKALLAALPRRSRREYLADQGLRPFTSRTPVELDPLEQELESIRRSGEVCEHGEFRDGVACAGALVRRGDEAWALVVSIRGEDIPGAVTRSVQLAGAELAGQR
jgi:DNA-binding IclR family transcriptional regulator